jgi:broad specificity phosphatase PhoE
MIIKLVRHGQSETNSGDIPHGSVGDYKVQLTSLGESQAVEAGKKILASGFDFSNCLLYSSPYKRAMQTMQGLLQGAGINEGDHRIYQDPRLREVDHGYSDVEAQDAMRKEHGWFYYRFKGGESPADCYDRCCHFMESMMRQINRKTTDRLAFHPMNESDVEVTDNRPNLLIVMHGLTMRCFVTRFMHMTVDEFETLANPKNCDIVTIGHYERLSDPQFRLGKWGVEGLRFRASDKDASALV